ncbi:exodeoxyribonuclease VII large subunit [Xylanibacillus composti]|uniref:Exodeoxyribonuclease 7 large subunit n=1 Tax=Xylanibacillus composti TaxID=1572762 RepID=A0A8J4H494_9BACL|nr:exodeoxyribonuclease VII large subunit [Xylanibacillus composti]MDT9726293.1 exodeoxyribonuclease VII large subunit [Xylanibacillus composti]GIQ70678.1 exodeoxyribonuclease 7 large subunit [Xylanibacillus composti]
MDKNILSVKALTRYIKMRLEGDERLQQIWVQGEISNFTHHSSGHMYFTLKDKDSRVKCVMFSSYNASLGFIPKNGDHVLARGSISVYERDGQYQFYVTKMQPDGIGSLYLAFEALKRKLEAEGLFAEERKRRLPKFPQTVGLVTSPTGAAVRDMITTLQRRYPLAAILLFPVQVQGKQAARSIARAIEAVNAHGKADLLIVGRGGGSLEELWAFNEEPVARSIAASAIPVISAVGHETDYTIADFVADIRAATPTAAAELAVPHLEELRQSLHHLSSRLDRALTAHYYEPAQRLDRLAQRLRYGMAQRLRQAEVRYQRAERRLSAFQPSEQVRSLRQRLESHSKQLAGAMQGLLHQQKLRFVGTIRQLDALSPLKVMARGYSLAYRVSDGALMKSVRQAASGDDVRIRLHDGELQCEVKTIREIDSGM